MALRNLPNGKRRTESLRAQDDTQRRADSLGSDAHENGPAASNASAGKAVLGERSASQEPATPPLLQVELHVAAPGPKKTSTPPPSKPQNGAAKREQNSILRDPFLDSLDALRRTLRNQAPRKPDPSAGPPADPATGTQPSDAESAKTAPAAQPQSGSSSVAPASNKSDSSCSALENVPLPEVERAPTPLPQPEEKSAGKRRRKRAPAAKNDSDDSLEDALEAVRESAGLPKQENGRVQKASTPHPPKRRPLSDGIPKSVSEDLPKFRGQPRMRICNRCGHETKLRDPECRNCGKVDESLGILDAVISGDIAKVEQILLVRPHLISVQTNRHAWTLLHMAASGGNKRMAELLISKGAAVNATNRDGKTPLHYAAGKGHLNVVETLLAHLADLEARYNGKTAADLAHEHHQVEVETYLRKIAKSTPH